MRKYLVLCNRHLSVMGDNIALFWGSGNGKSKGNYSSDLRHAYLYTENEDDEKSDIKVYIDDLGMNEQDFERFREQKYPQYVLKDSVVRAGYDQGNVCAFEIYRDVEEELDKKYGYCSNNGCRCNGEECGQYEFDCSSDWKTCDERISWALCQMEE